MSCERKQEELQTCLDEIVGDEPPKLLLTHTLNMLEDTCKNRKGKITHASKLIHKDISKELDNPWERAKREAESAISYYQRTKRPPEV